MLRQNGGDKDEGGVASWIRIAGSFSIAPAVATICLTMISAKTKPRASRRRARWGRTSAGCRSAPTTIGPGLLDNRNFPSIEDLDPEALPDFGPYSVLLDFTGGIDNPAILYLGDKLSQECGAEGTISALDDVPSRSLLSRITDHYMQILANQAPIGFEAEFVNQRESTVLYRGILLPFSSDDDNIDFIYGVINWKELADQRTTDELLLEIDQALSAQAAPADQHRRDEPLTEWADGPADLDAGDAGANGVLDLAAFDDVSDGLGTGFPRTRVRRRRARSN